MLSIHITRALHYHHSLSLSSISPLINKPNSKWAVMNLIHLQIPLLCSETPNEDCLNNNKCIKLYIVMKYLFEIPIKHGTISF